LEGDVRHALLGGAGPRGGQHVLGAVHAGRVSGAVGGGDVPGQVQGDRTGAAPDVEQALARGQVGQQVGRGIGGGADRVRADDTLVVAVGVHLVVHSTSLGARRGRR